MEPLKEYFTKEGWKRDWNQTKEDFGYLFRKKSGDRVGDFINCKGDYSGGRSLSEAVESFWGQSGLFNYLPQYRFLLVPIYKLCGGRERPVLATMATFTASELIHDWGLIPNLMEGKLDSGNYSNLALWLGSGLIISYAKAKRKSKKKQEKPVEGLEEVVNTNI